MHKQKGMTLIGWIGVIAILLVLALAGLRLVPVYLEYFRVSSVLADLPIRAQNDLKASPKAINDYLIKRFDVEAIRVIQPGDVDVKREGDFYVVRADYDHVVPYVANVNFMVEFEKEVKVPR